MTSLIELGITSQQQADELERDLGVRFDDFTPEDCETWFLQTNYLDQYSRTRAVSFAADHAGVTIRTARQWQAENTLGFNNRLELAVLRYTDVIEVMLLRHAQEPKASSTLLMMLARAHMPEKYGSARRSGPPRDENPTNHHCDHDSQPTSTSQYDRELLEEVLRDLQNLKQFAGLTKPDFMPEDPDHDLSPIGEDNPAHSDLSPAGEETQTGGAPTPQHPAPSTQNLDLAPSPTDQASLGTDPKPANDPSAHSAASPPTPSPVLGEGWGEGPAPSTQNLNRRQRRELQRRAKRQKSHLARAPN
ncbi:MAG: hypothetical protein F4Y50_06680 [Dehalococcoidia bacterium]|nr:hypothetical protein [Dehalococcoidia bacterium]